MTLSGTADKFEEHKFMKELVSLRDTQEAVQSLSGWCIRNRKFAYKISRCWLKCAKKVKTEQKLTLFYLLNDIVQHCKRKSYPDVLDKFEVVLREVMPYMKDQRISEKVSRCLNIWCERQVYPDTFVSELSAAIRCNNADQDQVDNFQPQHLCTQIKILKALEDDTDYKLKTLKQSDMSLVEMDEASLRQNLKDRQHGDMYIHDVDQAKERLEQCIKAIDREISKRRQVIELLCLGSKYYESLCGEASIVANAYASFGRRLNNIKLKLHNQMMSHTDKSGPLQHSASASLCGSDASPVPSPPDYDAPSPQAGEFELELPEEQPQLAPNLITASSITTTTTEGGTAGTAGPGQHKTATNSNPEAQEEWWSPPAVTSWPEPKPDSWAADSPSRLRTNSDHGETSAVELLQITGGHQEGALLGDPVSMGQQRGSAGQACVDMDMCSDDDSEPVNGFCEPEVAQEGQKLVQLQDRLLRLASEPQQELFYESETSPLGPGRTPHVASQVPPMVCLPTMPDLRSPPPGIMMMSMSAPEANPPSAAFPFVPPHRGRGFEFNRGRARSSGFVIRGRDRAPPRR